MIDTLFCKGFVWFEGSNELKIIEWDFSGADVLRGDIPLSGVPDSQNYY
jgi:hypothetical protein